MSASSPGGEESTRPRKRLSPFPQHNRASAASKSFREQSASATVPSIAERVAVWLAAAPRHQRAASVAFAVFANFVLLFLLLASNPPASDPPATREIQAFLIARQQEDTPLQPEMQRPDLDLVPAPDIEIDPSPEPDAIQQVDSAFMAQVLAPRPDPAHHNQPPAFAANVIKASGLANLVLKILVQPDGTITDAQVTISTGEAQLDSMAMAFVKAHWRFRPATVSGRPIQYWTTVLVPIRPA